MVEHSRQLNEAARTVALGLRRGALEPFWLICVALCVELPVFTLAFWFAQYAAVPAPLFSPFAAAGVAMAATVFFMASMVAANVYRSAIMADRVTFAARSILCLILPATGLVLLAPFPDPAAGARALVISLAAVLLPTRVAAQVVMRWVIDMGLVARRAIIAGGGEEAERLIRGLNERAGNDIRLYGIFDDRDDIRSPTQVLGVPKIGGYSDLLAFVRSSNVDLVIIALPFAAEARIRWLLDEFRVLPVEVGLSTYSRDYSFGQPGRAPFLGRISRSFAPRCRLTKRVFDVFFALCALAILWPLMLFTALAIRLESRGPVLFRQPRHGFNHSTIEVLKFRSMYAEMTDVAAKQVVTRNDPRVTKVGRFIRRTSIDELPQLFNVLRGDLSLVGPRPHAVDALSSQQEKFSQIVDGYSARHRLPPGITGWAQINGWRGEIDAAEKLEARFEHDLYYIENWSLWLDFRILLRTPLSLLNSQGAY